jgi:TRAP transporter TAXI family solute receptor
MTKASPPRPRRDHGVRERWRLFGPAIALTLAGFIVAYQFVEPAPPSRIAIATGRAEGAYHGFAERYAEILARDGITLEVRATSGSLANLDLLADPASGIDLAFVQGGTGTPAATTDLRSLGSLYFEPLWIFTREQPSPRRIPALAGRRVATGGEGSGTRAVALQLLADNGLTDGVATLLPLGGNEAAEALLAGEVDAAFFVASPKAPVIARLLKAKDIRPMSLARAEAYARRYRFLSRVTLPEGVIDFARNIPDREIALLAPAATLVARAELHPALTVLLLEAAGQVHRAGGLFETPGAFPAPHHLDFPLNEAAGRYFEYGPPFLQRYMPFWAADLIDRLKVMLLPLVTLLFPLFKIVPPTYRWRVRSRIYRWYRELQTIDDHIGAAGPAYNLERLAGDLTRIEQEVTRVSVPLAYADALYDLRLHIAFVRDRLQQIQAGRRS